MINYPTDSRLQVVETTPTLDDKANLPYVNAVIQESFRVTSLVGFLINAQYFYNLGLKLNVSHLFLLQNKLAELKELIY